MKTLSIIIGIIFMLSSISYSQVKYQGTISTGIKIFYLDDGSVKYIKYNKKTEELSIFNLDTTLWKTVKLQIPEDEVFDEIKHISLNIFNNDDSVELIYTTIYYSMSFDIEDPEEDYLDANFTLHVICESGDSILTVKDGYDIDILSIEDQKKLLVYKRYESWQYGLKEETSIYSIEQEEILCKNI